MCPDPGAETRSVPQGGGVVFRIDGGEIRVLLIRDRDAKHWIFPKGHLEYGETAAEAAVREVEEEAGVRGVLVGPLEALDFQSAAEKVQAHYFLIAAGAEREGEEGREKRWLGPREAMETVSFPDARDMLRRAVPAMERFGLDAERAGADDAAFRDYLLAEHEHIGESFLRNEEDGERRVTFLITLAGGIAAALGFLLDKNEVPRPEDRHPALLVSLGLLAVLGYFTLVRIAHRNVSADLFKAGLNRIRRYFVRSRGDLRLYFLPLDPYDDAPREAPDFLSAGKGGWLQTVVLVEAILLGGLAAVSLGAPTWNENIVIGGLVAAVAWIVLLAVGHEHYKREMRRRRKRRPL